MKRSNITILLIIFMSICPLLYSQNSISYGYDLAGNRISRTIKMPGLKSATQEEQTSAVYSEKLSDIELRIYPNPTDGLLKVEIHNLQGGQKADILLYNLSGKLISSHRGISDFVTVDISDQPAGTYLMKIIAGTYQTEWKIIKT